MTAVEWLETRAEEREKNNPNESAYWHLRELIKDFEQAKEMEANVATEYAEFCIRCDRASLKQVKFEDWKKSWYETFKQK